MMEIQLRLPDDWPVGIHRGPSPAPAGDDLESVLTWLQEVEINAWVQATPPADIAAGSHDPQGGDPVNGEWPCGEIARWLLDIARQYYPRARQ